MERGAQWAAIYGVAESDTTEVAQQQQQQRSLQENQRQGTFHAKMGSIKDRNGRDLTEAKDRKKKWKEYTEELQKKDLHDPDNTML